MRGLGSRIGRGVGRVALGVTAAATAAALLAAPVAVATPESDASDAIDQAWQAIGGDGSTLGSKDGDVYSVGDGFGQNFTDGVYYFTPATGAHLLYGAVLDKYRELGGPADSDLGFPTMDEVTGLVGPDSRVSTFSASDKPAIFWTPDTGAWVVRGAINAAWDKLGGSSGALGVPVADETYSGDIVDQKFANGELSWNRASKTFTTVPADLAGQLTDVAAPADASSAINLAWRATGGLPGPLGARQGAQSVVGDNGAAQAYVGGKIFYSPDTGAHAVTGAILSKYESAGGPTGDLGYPIGTEIDGGAPNSRMSAFSAADKPVIFWTPDTGAIVVRGAINAAWAASGGAGGKLGVPTSQQTVAGDTVTQKFSAGEISWTKGSGKFTSKPADLAASLTGVEVPEGSGAELPNAPSHGGFGWQWWWLLVIIPGLLFIGMIAFGVVWLQRRRAAAHDLYDDQPHQLEMGSATSHDSGLHLDHGVEDGNLSGDLQEPDWSSVKTMPGAEDVFDGDQDALDTTPTRVPADVHPGFISETSIEDEPPVEIVGDEAEPDAAGPDEHAPARYDSRYESDDYGSDINEEPLDVEEEDVEEEDVEEEDVKGEDVEEEIDEDIVDTAADVADDVQAPAEAEDEDIQEAGQQEEASNAGRHSAVSAGEARSMWTVDVAGARPSGRRRAARERRSEPDQATKAHITDARRAGDTGGEARHIKSEPKSPEPKSPESKSATHAESDPTRPAIHLPLSDPYQPPEGYLIKANTHSGLYYTPECELYDHTVPEVWFASEELAQANGFVKAE